jgi:hypothetical protein
MRKETFEERGNLVLGHANPMGREVRQRMKKERGEEETDFSWSLESSTSCIWRESSWSIILLVAREVMRGGGGRYGRKTGTCFH